MNKEELRKEFNNIDDKLLYIFLFNALWFCLLGLIIVEHK